MVMALTFDCEFDRLENEHGWAIADHAEEMDGVWMVEGVLPTSVYNDDSQSLLINLVDSSWWYQIRNRLLVHFIGRFPQPKAIWDLGSGTGIVAAVLRDSGINAVTVEPNHLGAVMAASRGIPSIESTLEDLCPPPHSLPSIGLFDVIEHLENPGVLLTECRRRIEDNGLLFLSVPAYDWLWSDADTLNRPGFHAGWLV